MAFGSPNPFLQPGNTFGWPDMSFPTSPIADIYANVTETSVPFTNWTAGWAGGTDPQSRYVQAQRSRMEQAYLAAVMRNPNLKRTEFYAGMNPNMLVQEFNRMGPRGRNEDWQSIAGRARYQRQG